ncbi:low density lipoprotein receptor adapter protein 1a isoform X3 [Synchiropus splendidus]|uniref:low density lipoprotein receptor adapter protein 1a isoform X3 n=1 Tax=Synchiropus splendidus TaxID=270530 RepID=UPI00237E59B1|nr:low density lipoprotein receptor adapter protein 1a isoform X3 [Synchiropus splendidus]
MHAIKSAGRAIIRSPSVTKQSWTSGRHKKLPENWTDTREAILDGMTFNLGYLGMTLVDQPKGEDVSAAAVKRIIATAKASGKKSQKVSLNVSSQGLCMHDRSTSELIANVSIRRVSYCIVDKVYVNVFAYITQNTVSGTLECHAFSCAKKKVAQAVVLTVAQAFSLSQECLEEAKEEKVTSFGSDIVASKNSDVVWKETETLTRENLLDLDKSVEVAMETKRNKDGNLLNNQNAAESEINPAAWLTEESLEEAFSRLALSRTSPQILDFGLIPHDWLLGHVWDVNYGSS